jgi:hypothetical protein
MSQSENKLVEQPGSTGAPGEGAPAAVEHYGEELRESYLDRADHLTFRVDNGDTEHLFFSNGRSDAVKQVLKERKAGSCTVSYGLRADHCTGFVSSMDPANKAMSYQVMFDGRPDGVKSVHVGLSAGQRIDVATDCAALLYREKVLHVGVKLDCETAPLQMLEAYQDVAARVLRVVYELDDFGHRSTVNFSNDTSNDDERYDAAKLLVLDAIQHCLKVERELFVNFVPFAEGDDNAAMLAKSKERLYGLASSLFSAFDEISASPVE